MLPETLFAGKLNCKNYLITDLVFQEHSSQIQDFFSISVQFQDFSGPEKSKLKFHDFSGPVCILWFDLNYDTCVLAPSRVQGLEVEPMSPGLLQLSWLPPEHLNGNETVYVVQWWKQPVNKDIYELRNYCVDSEQFNQSISIIGGGALARKMTSS